MSEIGNGQVAATFGELLLHYRHAAGLTQEDLAAASGVSVRALSDLERGRARAAQRRSTEALADAMSLTGEHRDRFLAAAREGRRRGKPPAGRPAEEVAAQGAAMCALPASTPDLVGRAEEIARLREEAVAADTRSGAVVSIVGHPGVGKTALGVAAAHELQPGFPDGCFAVDLRGMDDQPVSARAALDQLLRALGVPAQQIPASTAEQSSLFRSMLSGRRVLVLLDNAADEAQVRPLLAASPGCLTLITCRQALAGLEAARWVWLDPLADTDAIALLASVAGTARVTKEPAAAAEIATLCGNLPLAVRIAGNRLATRPHWSVEYLAAQLRGESTRLTALSAGDLQVRSAFEVSHRRLSDEARLVFRRLAVVPGADFGGELAAIATGMAEAEAREHAEELVDANLLQAAVAPERFQFHDLIRIFAGERLEIEEPREERDRAAGAVLDHLLHQATEGGSMFYPEAPADGGGDGQPRSFADRDQAAAWLEREASNWRAAQREAAKASRHREVIALARAMHWYSDGRTQQQPWDEIFGLGVESARALGSRPDEAVLLNFLGWARYFCLEDNEGGLRAHQQALAVAVDIGDQREQAWALGYLGSVLMRLGRLEEALDHARQSVEMSTKIGYWAAQSPIRNTLGAILRSMGRYEEALEIHREVLADIERPHDGYNPAAMLLFKSHTQFFIGEVLMELRDWAAAAETFREAEGIFEDAGLAFDQARAAMAEARALRAAGEYSAAEECLRPALALLDDPTTRLWHAQALAELATVLEATGDTDTARSHREQARALYARLGTDPARKLAESLKDA